MSEPVVGPPRDDPPESRPDLPVASEGAPAPDGASRGRRRRGSRGGRRRRRSPGAGSAAGRPPAEQPEGGQEAHDAGGARPADLDVTRLPDDLPDRPIEGRASPEAAARAEVRPKIGDTRPAPVPGPPATGGEERPEPPDPPGGDGRVGRRRRRGGRGRIGGARPPIGVAGEEDAADDGGRALELAEEEAPDRRRGRARNGRPVGRYLMCVQVRPNATQIAVLEGRALIEHYVSRPQDDVTQIDGNVYLGRVQNVLPGMEAAFVDIGTPKNAVLYRGDVRYDPDDLVAPGDGAREGAPVKTAVPARIEQLLRPGQTLVCQVTKNPIGTKGARLTQEVSLQIGRASCRERV
jgi:ribonuclease E